MAYSLHNILDTDIELLPQKLHESLERKDLEEKKKKQRRKSLKELKSPLEEIKQNAGALLKPTSDTAAVSKIPIVASTSNKRFPRPVSTTSSTEQHDECVLQRF
ncbi:uncharacterized protein LOC118735486 [Rhagoletis pomonella]|uniref:uncharacterized protein LOC118735486 n=1 Tax=Rhagoletis pomonella TaxID=28610 RepID=UPI00177AB670|nr:uncharacterized protein LOC118735486 [Rhagoletis pomonella]